MKRMNEQNGYGFLKKIQKNDDSWNDWHFRLHGVDRMKQDIMCKWGGDIVYCFVLDFHNRT